VLMVPEVGMFANPLPSSVRQLSNNENAYQIAYLQALMPTQSRAGGYRLVVMDRDGSNSKVLFPPEGNPGLEPQRYYWSPETEEDQDSSVIAVIYQGNIWLIDIAQGTSQQLTGDGLITAIDWN
jgi:hypothetical protein